MVGVSVGVRVVVGVAVLVDVSVGVSVGVSVKIAVGGIGVLVGGTDGITCIRGCMVVDPVEGGLGFERGGCSVEKSVVGCV